MSDWCVELLRDMDVERSAVVDRAAWRAYLSARGSQGETQRGDLIAELLQIDGALGGAAADGGSALIHNLKESSTCGRTCSCERTVRAAG